MMVVFHTVAVGTERGLRFVSPAVEPDRHELVGAEALPVLRDEIEHPLLERTRFVEIDHLTGEHVRVEVGDAHLGRLLLELVERHQLLLLAVRPHETLLGHRLHDELRPLEEVLEAIERELRIGVVEFAAFEIDHVVQAVEHRLHARRQAGHRLPDHLVAHRLVALHAGIVANVETSRATRRCRSSS